MGQWKRIVFALLSVFVFMLAVSSSTDAAEIKDEPTLKKSNTYTVPVTGDLVPKDERDPKSTSLFGRYGLATFQLDYLTTFEPAEAIKENCGFSWKMLLPGSGLKCAASVADKKFDDSVGKYLDVNFYINVYNTMLWQNYITAAFALVKFVSWAFTLEIITIMLNAYKQAMLSLQKLLWEPMMYMMWAVAVAWMIYYWISGKKTKLWSTFINSLIIIALSATVFTQLPTFLQTVSNASTDVSITILSGLVGQDPSKELNEATPSTHRDVALRQMNDSMNGILLDLPYILINFGNPNIANKIGIDGLLKKGYDFGSVDRSNYLKERYDAFKKENNKDAMKQMQWMTAEKAPQRLANTVVIMLFAFATGVCFCIIAALTIIWQFIALGRGLLAALYLLISLWPEYGMKEAFLWLWSMIQALFMKVFYSIILAIYIIMVVALAAEVEEMGFLLLWLLAIGMFIGLMIALKEFRQKLESIPFGNGVFGKGATNEAENVLKKGAELGLAAAGIGAAVAATAAGQPHLARMAMNVANKGIGGAIKGEATKQFGGGDGSLAQKVQKNRAERKERNTAEAEYQERTSGLNPEDRALANHIRDVSGIDVTTDEGRALLNKAAPTFADNNAAALNRIGQHNLAQRMAKEMPRHMPPPGSLQHEMLARKFGEENVEMWREANANEWESVETKLSAYNNLSAKEKVTTAKPTMTNAGVQKQFEKLQLGNRLNDDVYQIQKNAVGNQVLADFNDFRQQLQNKNAIGDHVLANFSSFREQIQNKNAIGQQVYESFKQHVANTGTVVLDLNQMNIPSMGAMGSVGDKSLNVKVTGNLKQHLPNNAEEAQKVFDTVQKQIYEQLRTEGIHPDKIEKPVTVNVDMPVAGGTFGTQKVEVVVDKVNTGGGSGGSNAELDASVLRDQISHILSSASTSQNITPPGKIELASNFIIKYAGIGDNTNVVELSGNIVSELQKNHNFVKSNPDASVDGFAPSQVFTDFLGIELNSLEEQIRHMQKDLKLKANTLGNATQSFLADMTDAMGAINEIKTNAEKSGNTSKTRKTPPTPPSGGGSTET
ncbi:hypothetical protein [Shimazuella kribbensis]|uniref:hypothetical protein n=1 Tax=Shimazuella kribbensis TaxID=139808 RepID=UPI0003FF92D9|nr:hypothetical protein [Shimazuella kribbensis]